MKKGLLFLILLLSFASLYLEQLDIDHPVLDGAVVSLDILIMGLLLAETFLPWFRKGDRMNYFLRHRGDILFVMVFFLFFLANRIFSLFSSRGEEGRIVFTVIRQVLLFFKIFGRFRKVTLYLNSIFDKPAQTVILSFFMVILAGCLLLMLPFSAGSGEISFLDALFTSASAVCVTGLTVVSTGTDFSLIGQIVIVVLIQIGGLGIMLLSYFVVFLLRKEVSLEDRALLSFMLNKSDFNSIRKSVKRIILLTFSIEGAGALLLALSLAGREPFGPRLLWESLFHGVSAFCNAGFALYPDSLESFKGNLLLNVTVALLIIAGGLSFAVMTELFTLLRGKMMRRTIPLSVNSRIVLIGSALLILLPLLAIYALEHHRMLAGLSLKDQYLTAFFQSVTLRTAGFNSLPFGSFRTATLVMMLGVMFVGGASGSTAGGIKINTLGAVWAYFLSLLKGRDEVLLKRHQISPVQVLQAFSLITFGAIAVMAAAFVMALSEEGIPFIDILFECVSAFATVGLSTGITGLLSPVGKWCIIFLMFLGRIGPLTLLAALTSKAKAGMISYPETTLQIG